MYINTIKHEKNITIDLIKVKGHSGDRYNDLADKYAKIGGTCEDILDIGFISCNSKLKFFPYFQTVPITQKIRKFTMSTLQLFNCAEWTHLNSQKSNFSSRQCHWKTSWMLFKNLIGFRCNRVKKNIDWSFLFKIFHKSLPLGHTLKL